MIMPMNPSTYGIASAMGDQHEANAARQDAQDEGNEREQHGVDQQRDLEIHALATVVVDEAGLILADLPHDDGDEDREEGNDEVGQQGKVHGHGVEPVVLGGGGGRGSALVH